MTEDQREVILAAEALALIRGGPASTSRTLDHKLDRLYAAVIANRVSTRFARRLTHRIAPAHPVGAAIALAASSISALREKYGHGRSVKRATATAKTTPPTPEKESPRCID